MRHHHQTPNRFSPLSSLCLLILLSESCHYAASSSLDESKADWTSDFEERPAPALKRASSYVRFGKRSDEQDDAEAQPTLPKIRRSNPAASLERASRASSYVRFGKRGGPPSRSSMIPQLHDFQMDDSESSGGFLPPRPMPCTLSYLSTLTTLEDKYAHIRECTGARRSYSGMRRATRGREASYVRYG